MTNYLPREELCVAISVSQRIFYVPRKPLLLDLQDKEKETLLLSDVLIT